MKNIEKNYKIVLFQSQQIRRVWYHKEWYYSVVDIVAVLTGSTNARDYWYKMKKREKNEAGVELSTICLQLKLESTDGKMREFARQYDRFRVDFYYVG
ncbi:MAG: hypothetical protein A2233_01735 [Candidatus Kerfeldbacteria bacterium RIFOXYA2_FULL_38_24]|uniref:Bro-N domain-containing protein n=1 Tax=Candidatus Kerfeldbacteria bacterium RIFOXYB2_FULL_38_14 TaxID=1798547 RepID=A0A1G2BEL3_9BACT|nr:MAG: hypothetical protein A2319_04340 [Candidatus Kerfeldbacteria bacterium RIFOXYB2_FULL_38_14]OGY87840.1 MAG: hypothetical protein A2233_01735 [Candidatus Kerfeldbacteria bacterium RIFOXYA2_FULL_38_24]OGY88427.1 MAG: hypothetical protein A2458_00560 [Candidatus Kerfeldbacteria bacterium RIFOXYC2_FULL_38_9]